MRIKSMAEETEYIDHRTVEFVQIHDKDANLQLIPMSQYTLFSYFHLKQEDNSCPNKRQRPHAPKLTLQYGHDTEIYY